MKHFCSSLSINADTTVSCTRALKLFLHSLGKYSKKKRLILDLFAPHNDTDLSIHELIDKAQCSMSYVKIDDAIKII
jgi:hypothetical protein